MIVFREAFSRLIEDEEPKDSSIEILNYTPHEVNVKVGEKEYKFPSVGNCRVSQTQEKQIHELNGIPVYKIEYGEVENLPSEKENTWYIVSQMIKDRKPERKDLLTPAKLIRDGSGKIIGCGGFAQ